MRFTGGARPEPPAPRYRNQKRARDFDTVARSGLFDADFYQEGLRARGERIGNLHPVEHYFTRGDAAGVPPSVLFDPGYYAETNPDVVAAGIVTLLHFVNHGASEMRRPHPLFDVAMMRDQLGAKFTGNPLVAYLTSQGPRFRPHELIDPAHIWKYQREMARNDLRPTLLFYLDQDPDLYNPSEFFDAYSYARIYGDLNGAHPLYHYVRYGRPQGRRIVPEAESLKLGRGGDPAAKVREQIEAAASLEPDIIKPFVDVSAIPISSNYNLERTEYRLWSRLRSRCGAKTFTHVVMTPWLKRGGAERVIANLARALLARGDDGRVLILCTTEDVMDAASWLPPSDRLTVVAVNDVVDNSNNTYVAFCNFLRFARCEHLYVVNSGFGWSLVEKYGHAILPLMTTYGFVFCHDYDSNGRRAGFAWTHLRAASRWLGAMVTDNSRVIGDFLAEHYAEPSERDAYFCLPQPVDPALRDRMEGQLRHNLSRADHGRPLILWAGRFDRQKGIELAIEISAAMPDVDFHFHGFALAENDEASPKLPANASARGEFERFGDLPLHEAVAFLHTSHWDGMPNVLLEAGCAGLPIVATDVGGVGELVDERTGWLLRHGAGVDAYVAAIREILQKPDATIARCQAMKERIASTRSPGVFIEAVSGLLDFAAARRRALLAARAREEERS